MAGGALFSFMRGAVLGGGGNWSIVDVYVSVGKSNKYPWTRVPWQTGS